MQILDTPLSAPESKPFWNSVLRYGLLGGIGYVLFVQVLYHSGINEVSRPGMIIGTLFLLLISAAVSFFSIKRQRDQLDGGFIRAGKALLISTLTIYLCFLVLNIWNYLYLNYINPDYISDLKQQTAQTWAGKMPQSELNRTLAQLDSLRQFPAMLLYSLLYQSPIGIIAGGVVALFMARKFRT